jgi:hypothetical protein
MTNGLIIQYWPHSGLGWLTPIKKVEMMNEPYTGADQHEFAQWEWVDSCCF